MNYNLNNLKDKVALVTGASSGIGRVSALMLAAKGVNLKLTARRGERLEALKTEISESFKVNVEVVAADIAKSEDFNKLEASNFFDVDICVNNAGLALGKDPIADVSDSDIETMMQVNVVSAAKVLNRCVKAMKAKGVGDIVNICSISSYQVYAGGAVYCGSKHALLAIGKALREETRGSGLRVINVSPGMVETEFSEVRFGDSKAAAEVYKGMTPLVAEDVAFQVVQALECPRHVNLSEIVIMPSDQASATNVARN